VDPQLPGFLNSLAPYLKDYGYLAIAVIVTIESFGPPLPGETIIIAASLYAGAGRLNIWLVILIAFSSAVVGDNIGYFIGRKGGRALVERHGKYVGATEERFAKAEAFFVRNGRWVVIVARFIEGLRQLNGVIAGTTGMRWRTFAMSQVLGAALWVGLWATVGYNSGSHVEAIYSAFSKIGYGLFALVVIAAAIWWFRRRRKRTVT
jgi:membrane protein DedA with SNARE-associated domain